MLTLLSVASVILFAASGGKKKGNSSARSNLSVRQSTQVFSLRSGYQFKGNRLLKTDDAKRDYISLNNYNSVRKGNTTYFIASKHILNKTPQVVVQNNMVEVKLLKLKFD
jgi:hypothetical protein